MMHFGIFILRVFNRMMNKSEKRFLMWIRCMRMCDAINLRFWKRWNVALRRHVNTYLFDTFLKIKNSLGIFHRCSLLSHSLLWCSAFVWMNIHLDNTFSLGYIIWYSLSTEISFSCIETLSLTYIVAYCRTV